ncbi:monovalent cation/H(+) antiporter subunit G [Cyanobium sp. NS01]|uniref:monovalent cation/H(+) antiporter subunit G n=1 Tax=Cyanobium sp. NS01 TaxID=261284 RepID=UPI0018605D25|nr:monovalent cation/H(+) antiporter subunit G [Cyanobium sp. NS01]QNI70285.1 multiprotein Na+/H+ antiporter/ subunit G [Cyanobium sp. NS01]
MNLSLVSMVLLLSGLVFWFSGTWPLLGRSSFLRKLHYLGIADTLGSALMVVGLLLRFVPEWPLLLLALLSLVVWNTIFGYVLASCSQPLLPPPAEEAERPAAEPRRSAGDPS